MDSNNNPESTGRRENMTRIDLCCDLQEPCKLEVHHDSEQVLTSARQSVLRPLLLVWVSALLSGQESVLVLVQASASVSVWVLDSLLVWM
jgi:hypothetical protein